MPSSTGTEFAISMRRNFDSDRRCPQVCDIAQERHRTLTVAVLQFSIGGAHAADRLNAAVDALRHPRTLTHSDLVQGMLPRLLETAPYIECFLLRDHANAHLAVGVDGEGVHPPTTEILGVDLGEAGRFLQVMFDQPAVLAGALGGVEIERHHFFRRQPHCQRTLRTVNSRIELAIALEFNT